MGISPASMTLRVIVYVDYPCAVGSTKKYCVVTLYGDISKKEISNQFAAHIKRQKN